MLCTYRAKVDEDGIIRLLEPVKLTKGCQVLVTFLDHETVISATVSSSETGLSEEQLREEMEEDEYWAHLLKDLPSL